MRPSSPTRSRAASILVLAVIAVAAVAGTSPGATKFLTKKKALKLFYTKGQVDEALMRYYTKTESDGRYIEGLSSRTGFWSCSHWVFQGATSADTSATDGFPQYKYGEGPFGCHVNLPNGATVTSFEATVHDLSGTEQEHCYLEGTDLTTTFGASDVIANVFTGAGAMPGNVRVSATFSPETVDNQNFAYEVACVGSATSATGFYGVTIGYTLTAGQGAAA